MPRTPSLLSIRRTTTITLVNSNLTMIQGDLRHIDGSTTITNRDAFNIENTVTEQQSPPTASLMIVGTEAPTTLVSPDSSAARQTQDTDRTSDMPSGTGTRGSRHVEMAVSVPSTVCKFN